MKTNLRHIILTILVLSSAICGAETRTITHWFQSLFSASPAKITIANNNQRGTTEDNVTYTCSSGGEFLSDISKTASNLSIFLEKSNAQVVTSPILNLDSIRIHYYPSANKDMYVAISSDSLSWSNVSVSHESNGIKTVKLPTKGDYYVRIKRKSSDNVYVWKIEYFYIDSSGCPNCRVYVPE